jgi:hypothetical protein
MAGEHSRHHPNVQADGQFPLRATYFLTRAVFLRAFASGSYGDMVRSVALGLAAARPDAPISVIGDPG